MAEFQYDRRDLVDSVYQTHFKRNSLVGVLGCIVFFCWTIFDYVLEEPEFYAFFIVRLFVLFTSSLIFLFRKTGWYYHNHMKFNAFLLTLLMVSLVFFTIHSPHPVAHFGGIGFIFLIYPVLGVSEVRYIFPMVLTLVLSLIFQHAWLLELEPVIRNSLLFYSFTTLGFSILGLHLRFSAALENEESKMKVKDGRVKLIKGNEERKKLLRVMSHDLSNSLILIQASAAQLKKIFRKENAPKRNFDLVDRIEKASQFQQEVIEHVRMNEALKGGKIQIKPQCVTVSSVFERAKVLFQDTLEKKNIRLEKDVEGEDLSFIADEVAFSNHVFNNIISNAIKFSFEGSKILVRAHAIDTESMVIEIKDSGVGMENSLLSVLFESDKKTSRIGTNGEKGTGFGMPLIKTYVELFGGDVSIQSTPKKEGVTNHGTTIILRLKTCWKAKGECPEVSEIA